MNADDETTRDLYAPESDGWVRDALGPVLERAERERQAAEEHAATCTARPCTRCERYACSRCGNPVDGREVCNACADAEHRRALLAPTLASIPAHFRWTIGVTPAALARRVQLAAERVARGLERPPTRGLVFVGGSGTGKTSLACAMLAAWATAEPTTRTGALFLEAAQLSRARARHRLGADEAPLVVTAMTCPLLVLDDLGAEREDRDGCIADVLWERTNHDRPLWITTGLVSGTEPDGSFAETLARRYDGGFTRRVIEHCRRVTLGAKS